MGTEPLSPDHPVRVLLVDDDHDDFVLTRELLAELPDPPSYSAVRGMLKAGRDCHLALTPDGPRGPRQKVKPGLIYLAARLGLPIVPVGFGYERPWRLQSWDRFALPVPFGTLVGVLGEELRVPAGLDRDGLERYRKLVEERCLAATAEAEARAARTNGTAAEERRNEARQACA